MFGLVEPCVCGQVQWGGMFRQAGKLDKLASLYYCSCGNKVYLDKCTLFVPNSNGIAIAKLLILILIFFSRGNRHTKEKKEGNG